MSSGANRPAHTIERLLWFAAEVLASAFLVWFLATLVMWILARQAIGDNAVDLAPTLVGGLLGVMLASPSRIGTRYIRAALHLLPSPIIRSLLEVCWFLVLGFVWKLLACGCLGRLGLVKGSLWACPAQGLFPVFALAGLLFYISDSLKDRLAAQRYRRRARKQQRAELRRRQAFQIRAKTCSGTGAPNTSSWSDPRLTLPMPLPLAVALCEEQVRAYKEKYELPIRVDFDRPQSFPTDLVLVPEVLCTAVTFAAEYILHRGMSVASLDVSYHTSPRQSVWIATNVKAGDLWFRLKPESAARQAKLALLRTLNRYVGTEYGFEVSASSSGSLVFIVWAGSSLQDDRKVWERVADTLGKSARPLLSADRSNGATRVYIDGDTVHKVQLLGKPSPKPLMLAEEYQILQQLSGIRGIPQVIDYRKYEDFAMLSCRRIEGIQIDEYLQDGRLARSLWFRTIAELTSVLEAIHRQGVMHRDLRPDNILVSASGEVHLLDFDQAVVGSYTDREVDTLGKPSGDIPPSWVSLKALIGLLRLQDEYEAVVAELAEAWSLGARSDASSPGGNIAYYSWSFGYTTFPGEREWNERWDLMYSVLRDLLPGSRVLDLGCNQGLISVYCMLFGAKSVTAVDREHEVLTAARRLASAAGVTVTFLEGDLNHEDFVSSRLRHQNYDLVVALSVIHWLQQPEVVSRVLAEARHVLYEGHRPHSDEVEFLHGLGFDAVQLVGYSERLRPLLLASRPNRGQQVRCLGCAVGPEWEDSDAPGADGQGTWDKETHVVSTDN